MEWFDVSPNDIALLHLVMAALEPTAQPDVSLVFFVLDRLRGRANRHETFGEFLVQLRRRVSSAVAAGIERQLGELVSPNHVYDRLWSFSTTLQSSGFVAHGIDSSTFFEFARRIILAFHKSSFEGLARLTSDLVRYTSNSNANTSANQILASLAGARARVATADTSDISIDENDENRELESQPCNELDSSDMCDMSFGGDSIPLVDLITTPVANSTTTLGAHGGGGGVVATPRAATSTSASTPLRSVSPGIELMTPMTFDASATLQLSRPQVGSHDELEDISGDLGAADGESELSLDFMGDEPSPLPSRVYQTPSAEAAVARLAGGGGGLLPSPIAHATTPRTAGRLSITGDAASAAQQRSAVVNRDLSIVSVLDYQTEKEPVNLTEFLCLLPVHDIGRFVQDEVSSIERRLSVTERNELEERVEMLVTNFPTCAAVHYLAFMFYQYHLHYSKAEESLHRYFDCCPQTHTLTNPSPEPGAPKVYSTLPYASLNLASLHARFGHPHEALVCVFETAKKVQSCLTDPCTVFCLSWLYRIIQRSMRSNTDAEVLVHLVNAAEIENTSLEAMLAQAIKRGLDKGLAHLTAVNLLAMAETLLENQANDERVSLRPQLESRVSPSEVWRIITESEVLATRYRHAVTRPFGLTGSDAGMRELFSAGSRDTSQAAHLLRANCWSIYGHSDLAELYSHLPLQHVQDASQLEPSQSVLVHCQLASQATLRGDLEQALHLLSKVRDTVPVLPHASGAIWVQTMCNVLSTFAVLSNDLNLARLLSVQLYANSHADDSAMAHFRSASLYAAVGERYRALAAFERLAHSPRLPVIRQLESMLAAGQLLLESDPFSAMRPLLECVAICERLHFDALHAVACIAVAECQLRLQMTTKALALLASKMHMILQHCDCLSQAKAQLLIAKCKLQLHQGAASGMTKTELYEPLSHLDMAQKGFTKVNAIKELQQVHYLRARIHHHLKNFTERDQAAQAFRRLSLLLETQPASMQRHTANIAHLLPVLAVHS